MITKKVYNIDIIRSKFSNNVNIKIPFEEKNKNLINDLYDIAMQFPGKCNLILHIFNNKGLSQKIQSDNISISNQSECIKMLSEKIGSQNIWIS